MGRQTRGEWVPRVRCSFAKPRKSVQAKLPRGSRARAPRDRPGPSLATAGLVPEEVAWAGPRLLWHLPWVLPAGASLQSHEKPTPLKPRHRPHPLGRLCCGDPALHKMLTSGWLVFLPISFILSHSFQHSVWRIKIVILFFIWKSFQTQQIASIRRVKTKTNPQTHRACTRWDCAAGTCSCILLSLCGQMLFAALSVLWAPRLLTGQRPSFPAALSVSLRSGADPCAAPTVPCADLGFSLPRSRSCLHSAL